MQSKKLTKKQNEIKYCSDRCRSRKPGKLDRKIEQTIAALLNAEEGSGLEKTAAKSRTVKGDHRIVITCDEVEEIMFGSRFDPEKVYGRRKNRKRRWTGDPNAEWKTVDMEDTDENEEQAVSASDSEENLDEVGGVRIRPPQSEAEENFSVGGERGRAEKIEETPEDLEKRRQGAKRAEEREMVRRAARRGIIFGLEVPRREPAKPKQAKGKGKHKQEEDQVEESTTERRHAEALMDGTVVEPSFAKGNWCIRWRE